MDPLHKYKRRKSEQRQVLSKKKNKELARLALMAVEEGIDDYTQDGTVDLKGNPVRRSKRGGWTACSFVVGNLLTFFPCLFLIPIFSPSFKGTVPSSTLRKLLLWDQIP